MVQSKTWVPGLFFLAFSAAGYAADVNYSQDIKPVLEAHCTECHHPGARKPDLSQFPFTPAHDGDSQDTIVQKIVTMTDTSGAKMPPGSRTKLSRSDVDLIRAWREQGLKP